jgi:Domain of unknown function (DUF4340)
MSFKTTYVLFGVLLGMLGLFGLMLIMKSTTEDFGYVLPSFHDEKKPVTTADIDTVEIAPRNGDTMVFVRRDQGWYLQKPEIRLEAYRVNDLVREVSDARREEDADVSSNLREWGLDKPALKVTLKKGGSREWTVNLGKQSPERDGVVYVNSSDRPREVLAVKRSTLGGVVNFKLDDFRPRKLLDANTGTTQSLTLVDRGRKKEVIKEVILKRNAPDRWNFVKPKYGPAELEPGIFALGGVQKQSPGVRELLQSIDGLQVEGFEPLGQKNLQKFGLQDGARATRIIVENSGGGSFGEKQQANRKETLLIGNKVETKGKDRRGAGQYYARLLSEQAVVRVSAASLKTVLDILGEEGQRLRSLRLTQVKSFEPDAIDIRNRHGLIQLRKNAGTGQWQLRNNDTGVRKAQTQAVQALLTALNEDNQVKEFLDDKKGDFGLKDPKASVSLWVGGLAEKKDASDDKKKNPKDQKTADDFPDVNKKVADKPTVKLNFGTATKEMVYVECQVDGEVNRVAVPAAVLTLVEKDPLTYLDRNLSSFDPAAVTSLTLTIGKDTYEASHEGTGRDWKLKDPSINTKADAGHLNLLLGTLARMSVEQWVKVKPGPADLKKYGLDSPLLTAKIAARDEKTKKTQTWVYKFGETTKYDDGKKTGVYGQITGTDAVFLVNPRVTEILRETELRDRTVFPFKTADVTEIRIEGENDPVKRNYRLILPLKRDKDKWVIVPNGGAPAGFKFDEQKVRPFLNLLANLRLERFVKGAAKDAGLEEKKRTLFIELRIKGEKEPYRLTVGKPKQEERAGFYYAQSSSLPKDIFLIPQPELNPLVGNPPWIAFFQKAGE